MQLEWKKEEDTFSSSSATFQGLTISISKRYVHRKSKDKKAYNLSIYAEDNEIEVFSRSFDTVEACEIEAERLIHDLDTDRLMVFQPDENSSDISIPCVVVLSGEGHICILDTPDANNNMMCDLVDCAVKLARRYYYDAIANS